MSEGKTVRLSIELDDDAKKAVREYVISEIKNYVRGEFEKTYMSELQRLFDREMKYWTNRRFIERMIEEARNLAVNKLRDLINEKGMVEALTLLFEAVRKDEKERGPE